MKRKKEKKNPHSIPILNRKNKDLYSKKHMHYTEMKIVLTKKKKKNTNKEKKGAKGINIS